MRRGLATLALAVGVAGLAPATAGAAGVGPLAGHCSASGDVCFGIVDRGGSIRLELATAARYFARYTLCVRRPDTGRTRCGSFPVFRGGQGTWYSSVRLRRQFPGGGPGVYRVTWRLAGQPLGPPLRVPLPR